MRVVPSSPLRGAARAALAAAALALAACGGSSTLSSPPSGGAAGSGAPGTVSNAAGQVQGDIDPQEAMKMLQAIRDREWMRRLKKLNERRSRRIPVDRDW